MLFLLQVPGFILVGWMEDLFPFVSEETISFPAPPPHSLEIHIKQLQVNTCKRMPKSQSRIRGCCQVWIPQTQYAGFWVHVWKTTKERTGWFTKWVTKSFRNFKIPGIFKVLTFFFFFHSSIRIYGWNLVTNSVLPQNAVPQAARWLLLLHSEAAMLVL